MTTDEPTGRPSLSLVHQDDELLQQLADRSHDPADGIDDPVITALGDWVGVIDRDLPGDLAPEHLPNPSRRTVIVTRAGVAASVAAVVLSGVSVAAAATEGGFAGFIHKVDRAVEQGVAAPRPADPAVLATADETTSTTDRATTRKALELARDRLGQGDAEGARAILALVEDQVRRDPDSIDDGSRSVLAQVRDGVAERTGSVLAAGPTASTASSAATSASTRPGRATTSGDGRHTSPGAGTTTRTHSPTSTATSSTSQPSATSTATTSPGSPTSSPSAPSTSTNPTTSTSPTSIPNPTSTRTHRPRPSGTTAAPGTPTASRSTAAKSSSANGSVGVQSALRSLSLSVGGPRAVGTVDRAAGASPSGR